MSERRERDAEVTTPAGRRLGWRLAGVALGVALAAELFFGATGRFGLDGWFGFGAIYGFASCVLLVLLARLLGWVAKRPERYYEDRDA
jgi:Na+/proline symporter